MTPDKDWAAIRADYEAGLLPIATIAGKYGVEVIDIRINANKHGWVRRTIDGEKFNNAVNNHISEVAGLPMLPPESAPALTNVELGERAVLTAAQVVSTHRKDIARLRNISSVLVDRLGLVLEGKEITLPCLGGRESPADLLEKLSRVTLRVVEMERQAYGLDSFDPNANEKDHAEFQSSMSNMWQRLVDATRQKTIEGVTAKPERKHDE